MHSRDLSEIEERWTIAIIGQYGAMELSFKSESRAVECFNDASLTLALVNHAETRCAFNATDDTGLRIACLFGPETRLSFCGSHDYAERRRLDEVLTEATKRYAEPGDKAGFVGGKTRDD